MSGKKEKLRILLMQFEADSNSFRPVTKIIPTLKVLKFRGCRPHHGQVIFLNSG